ncbi:MAG: endonuclease Q family protein [Deltaproteobacteria bacterium]|nr:endonuclease Q family protein [Deltaproteobacteria bacterium]
MKFLCDILQVVKFIADLHIHSHYSRATSKDMTPENLWFWAQIKGIKVIGTGDFTHPLWLKELREKLEKSSNGLFTLKEEYRNKNVPERVRDEVYFLISGEVSTIYKKNGRMRKIHTLIFVPSMEDAIKIQAQLSKIGNIQADGRPIFGIDVKDLMKIVLDISPSSLIVPAHAWTPHFSVFGSESGFDSLEECFEEFSEFIFSIETGLSSDPPMNWRVSRLDKITLISNSDAHSPQKIGREANIFDVEISYSSIVNAIKTKRGFLGTIEFFPEEGKYHFDGHRSCSVVLSPKETIKNNYLCPKCGQKVTVGVMHRVEKLADRKDGEKPKDTPSYFSIIPLMEIIAEAYGTSVQTTKVETEYMNLITSVGNEFYILMEADLEKIGRSSSHIIKEGISRMREGKIKIVPGFDGVYGSIILFNESERAIQKGQQSLF